MTVDLYRTAVSMAAAQRQVETIASNLANAGTTGFKRDTAAAHLFSLPKGTRRVEGLATVDQVDFTQGELVRTGRPYDLALFGRGFFALEGKDGEVYTRDGQFFATSQGILVSDDGLPVAWDSFQTPIDPTGLPVVVDGDGTARQGPTEIGRLRLVDFADPQRMYQVGDGHWHAPADLKEVAHDAVVHQGALEQSNASAVEELVAMIAVQRAYDVTASAFSTIEQSYRRLTRPF